MRKNWANERSLNPVKSTFFSISLETSRVVEVWSLIGRFWIVYALNSCLQYQFEVFPTALRSQGSALVTLFGAGSQALSPYIAYSSVVAESLPFWILGTVGMAACILPLFLPETAGVDLPDTIEDAESLGKGQKFFSMPIFSRHRKQNRVYEPNA